MIEPALLTNTGTLSGVYSRMGDLSRRVSTLESSRGLLNGIDGGSIAPGTLPGSAIVAGSITTAAIAAGAITAELITAGAINAGHIAADSISAVHIQANAVTADAIAAGSIYAGALQAGSVTATAIAAGSIYAEAIQAGAVTATAIAADSINATHIQANAVTATEIAANSITATHIQANAVTATAISANSVYAAAIQAGAVTSDKITVTSLASITGNLGAITAGTITGATIQTSTSGSRIVIDGLGIRGYALDGITKVFEINTGSGVASFTGIANIDPLSVIPGGTITTGTLPGDRIVAASIGTAQLAAGSVIANTIAAGAVTAQKLSVEWGGNNHFLNSSFEDSVSMDAWSIYQGFPDTPTVLISAVSPSGVVPQDGTKVAKVERLGAGGTAGTFGTGMFGSATFGGTASGTNHAGLFQSLVALPGRKYTMSGYVMIPTTHSAQTVRLYVEDGLAAGGYWASSTTYAVPNDGVWRRYTYTFDYIPNGSAGNATGNLNAFFWMENAPGGSLMYVDSVQFEPGDVITAYARHPGEILTGEVGTTQITPNSITTNHIIAGTILGSDIAASTITGGNIQAGSITADKISVTTLSAISANLGTIMAGIITGATVRTADSGTRIVLDDEGFKQYLGASVSPSIHFKTDGSDTNVFTGLVNARGVILPTLSSITYPNTTLTWEVDGATGRPGSISAYLLGGADAGASLEIRAQATTDAGQMSRLWVTRSTSVLRSNQIAVQTGSTVSGGTLVTKIIYAADGVSDFLQIDRSSPNVSIRKINSGTHSYTANGTQSTTVTVSHGMTVTPTYVIVTQNQAEATAPPMAYQVYNITSTQFTVRCWSIIGNSSANDIFAWIAVHANN